MKPNALTNVNNHRGAQRYTFILSFAYGEQLELSIITAWFISLGFWRPRLFGLLEISYCLELLSRIYRGYREKI